MTVTAADADGATATVSFVLVIEAPDSDGDGLADIAIDPSVSVFRGSFCLDQSTSPAVDSGSTSAQLAGLNDRFTDPAAS